MKTRIGFWLLAAATVWFFGLPLLRAAAPPPGRNPFVLPDSVLLPGPLFLVFVITVVLASAGGSGFAARARVDSRDSRERDPDRV